MAEIKRYYTYAGDRRIHYRRGGEGPPLVMIHASPGSSFALEPLMRRLGDHRTVIAPDSPGYGETTGIGIDTPEIADYAARLAETLDALGVGTIDLYGSHTGSKVALEFALNHPERIRRLVLDGVGLYTDEEKADMLANYLIPLTPEWDGSHLVRLWTMRRDMSIFWPWYNRTAAGRIMEPMPNAERLHGHAVDLLRTEDYRKGYRAAFVYNGRDAISRLTLPTLLVTAASDPLQSHFSRLGPVPGNVTVDALPPSTDSRAQLADRINAFLTGDDLPAAAPPPAVEVFDTAIRRDYVDTRAGQVLMRRAGTGSGRPLILLHASPGSSLGLEPLVLAFAGDRPVVTFDNPGNGDSAPAGGTPEIGDLSDIIGDAIDALGLTDYDLYGTHTGAMIAMDLAIKRPDQVKHVILDGVTIYSAEKTAEIIENYPIPMRVDFSGSQLVWGWNVLRDMALWFPWYDKTPECANIRDLPGPAALHASFKEWIKSGTTYHQSYRAAFAYPTADRLPLLDVPTLHCASPTDPLREFLPEAVRLTKGAQSRVHRGRQTADGAAWTVGLFRAFLADEPLPEGEEE